MRFILNTALNLAIVIFVCSGISFLDFSPPKMLTASDDISDATIIMRTKSVNLEKAPKQALIDVLPQKQQYLGEYLPRLKGKTIHVVLQTHDSDPVERMTSEQIAAVESSQARVLSELKYIRPKLLVIEGVFVDEPNRAEIAIWAGLWKRYNSIVYANAYPQCIAVGMEPRVIAIQDKEYYRQNKMSVFLAAVRFRSYYSLARAAEKMEKYHLVRDTAIVIGAAHGPEFERAAKEFGFKLILHDAS